MTTWDEMPNGTHDIREAFAAELQRMGITGDVHEPAECAAWTTAPDGRCTCTVHDNGDDQCEECESTGRNCLRHSRPGSPGRSVHDNGDYRA